MKSSLCWLLGLIDDNMKFGGGFWVAFGRCTYEDWRWHGLLDSFNKRVVYIGGLGRVVRGRCSG